MAAELIQVFLPSRVGTVHLVRWNGVTRDAYTNDPYVTDEPTLCGKQAEHWSVTKDAASVCLSCRKAKERIHG